MKAKLIVLYLLCYSNIFCFNRSLFYRVSGFWDEPRFQSNHLHTLDIFVGSGHTNKFVNQNAETIQANNLSLVETNINYYANSNCGLFYHLHIPVTSLNYNAESQNGMSDSSFFLGYCHSIVETQNVDFVDISLQLGFLFPTSSTKFSFPIGYNGKFGPTWSFDVSFGMLEWLTFGFHDDGVFLRGNSQNSSVINRNGTYIKADHFTYGLSFLMSLGHEYESANLNSWSRTFFDIIAEYDFAQDESKAAPRLSFIYNHQISGRSVLPTNIIGGYICLDIKWSF